MRLLTLAAVLGALRRVYILIAFRVHTSVPPILNLGDAALRKAFDRKCDVTFAATSCIMTSMPC
ncbi:hypothetical protein RSAG8_00828, partial [Rhizoctonia solani AG-8 WAC10335]